MSWEQSGELPWPLCVTDFTKENKVNNNDNNNDNNDNNNNNNKINLNIHCNNKAHVK